jgi:hypothetical protein
MVPALKAHLNSVEKLLVFLCSRLGLIGAVCASWFGIFVKNTIEATRRLLLSRCSSPAAPLLWQRAGATGCQQRV